MVGATGDIKTQGVCQINGAAGASWMVMSIAMINAHKKKGRGIQLITPITKKKLHLAGLLVVNDTYLKHLNTTKTETTTEALAALQGAVMNWGRLLITPGGALKPAKCFYHLISFQWMADGTWRYDANHENPDFQIHVLLRNGELAPIEHLSVDSPTKTLGSMTCPSGCSNRAFAQMTEKAQGWVAQAIGKNLNCRHIWFLLERQLSPMVFFGIGCNTALFDSLAECLQRQWWEILPRGGVWRTAPCLLRQMESGFYGIGLPHPGVECFVAQMEKLLIHYGSKSGIGIYMQMSMEMFVTELGVSLQPFTASYLQYRDRVTHCWLWSLWEKVQLFKTWVEIAPLPMPFPRKRNKWLMVAFESLGFSRDKLTHLNCF